MIAPLPTVVVPLLMKPPPSDSLSPDVPSVSAPPPNTFTPPATVNAAGVLAW